MFKIHLIRKEGYNILYNKKTVFQYFVSAKMNGTHEFEFTFI